jgi:2'-5' RNA ligase
VAESAASIENDWLQFSRLDEMKNHWQREGWWPGRSGYYWYLTFEGAPALHELARACQTAIQDDTTYDLTPIDDLHMTLDRVGFEEEVTEYELQAVQTAAGVAVRNHDALTIDVGPLAGSAGALNFSVSPHAALDDLRISLSEASRTAVGSVASEGDFRPHVGIAYRNQPGPAAPVIETVARLRGLPPVRVQVDRVSLVRLTRADRAYVWTAIRTFPLGHSPTRRPGARRLGL